MTNEPAALSENGWAFHEKCRCSGIMKYRYRSAAHPDLELEWWVKYQIFKITYRGSTTKIPQTKIANLDQTLKAL